MRRGEVKSEKDDHGGQNQTAVQGSGQDIVVLKPPSGIASLDEEVEDGTHDSPAEVDVDTRGREPTGAAENKGRADVAPNGARPAPSEDPGEDRSKGADEPEPLEAVVDGLSAKDAGGANGTPDNGGGKEDTTTGAGVIVLLLQVADVGNVGEGPVHDDDLNNSRPDRGDELGGEHDARRHLHVVTKLQILSEIQGLRHANVAIVLKHHHGHGATGDHVTNDKLGEHVQAKLDVRDGLDDTDRKEPDCGEENADDISPSGETSRPASDNAERDSNHHEEQSYVMSQWLVSKGGKFVWEV